MAVKRSPARAAFFARRIPLLILNRIIRKNALLTRLLFGVRVRRYPRIHWDWTTLLLRGRIVRLARPGMEILEIGTGPFAMLAIHLARRVDARITASEINAGHARHARETVARHGVDVEIVQSDLFEHVRDRYDLMFFNAVYIPRRVGEDLGIDALHDCETDWCGGEEGTDTISRFLRDAAAHLRPGGAILLGFNASYLPEERITPIYREHGYILTDRHRSRLTPGCVLTLERNTP